MMIEMGYGSDKSDMHAALAACLHQTLSDAFMMYFMAHSFHWNVKGPEFVQFHDFFGDIYEDIHGSIDPIAENMRKLGFNSPMNLMSICDSTKVAQCCPNCDPMSMCNELHAANEIVLESLYQAFECASAANSQGIADDLAERIGKHEKWRWQLGTTLNRDSGMSVVLPGKLQADSLVEATDEVVEDQPETRIIVPVEVDSDYGIYAAASRRAPKKDRIYGSKTNKPGSAKAKNAKSIKFSDKTETALRNKMKEHNEKASAGRKTTMAQLKAVYRRGSGAYSSSHRPGKTRDQWAMARVNAYLRLLRSGRPENSNYTQDNDLLPAGHPRSSKKDASIVAGADLVDDELIVILKNEVEYETAEDAIFALAEFSDLGYEIIPALRSAWKRGVRDGESPFNRAYDLAILHHDSKDADLLPKIN